MGGEKRERWECNSVRKPLQPVFYGVQLLCSIGACGIDSRVGWLEVRDMTSSQAGEENGVAPRRGGHENVLV